MEAPVKVIHRDLKSRNGKVAKMVLLLPVNMMFKSVFELCECAELTNALTSIKPHLVRHRRAFSHLSILSLSVLLQSLTSFRAQWRALWSFVFLPMIVPIISAVRQCLDTLHFPFQCKKIEFQERLADSRCSRPDKACCFLSEKSCIYCDLVWVLTHSCTHCGTSLYLMSIYDICWTLPFIWKFDY